MKMKKGALLCCLAAALSSPFALRADQGGPITERSATRSTARRTLDDQVRRQLVMLPFYSIFDDLNYQVQGTSVTLTGKVTRPVLKSDAEAAVKHIEGVTGVINNIQVLPLSPLDNQLRRAVYFKLFSVNSPLLRYSVGANPSIHIIVENGHVTLVGVVSSKGDKSIASMLVAGTFGAFSVNNDLKISPASSNAAPSAKGQPLAG